MTTLAHFALGWSLLAVAAVAQTTTVVSGGGAALQNAIVAAAPGDTLLVQPGTYDAVTCATGLRIALSTGAQIGNSTGPSLSVVNLPVNERFQVDGGTVAGIAVAGCAGTVVVAGVAVWAADDACIGCPGAIVLDGVTYLGLGAYSNGRMTFTNCAQVSCRDSSLPQVTVTGSRVVLDRCVVRPYLFSAPGLHIVSGSLCVNGGDVTGSAAVFFSIARPGIQIDAGELVLTGGASIRALQYASQPAPGVLANGGVVRVDPSVTVTGAPPFGGASTVLTTPVPSLVATTAVTTLSVAARGRPGDVLVTFAGLLTAPYATPWGDAWLLPTDPILDVALLGPAGTSTFSRTFAAVPPFVVLTLQSVALAPNGALTIGAPSRFVWD
jgi:hypothetical protein